MLPPTNFLIGLGLARCGPAVHPIWASLGRKLVLASLVPPAICGFSPLASLLLSVEARSPPLDARRRARRHTRPRGSFHPQLSEAQRTTVFKGSVDRIVAAAALAHRYPKPASYSRAAAPIWLWTIWPRRPIIRRRCSKVSALPKTPYHGTALAQHRGKCRIFQYAGVAEDRRTMAAGDLGLPYAAVGRCFPQSRICCGAIPGRLAHRRAPRSDWDSGPLPVEGLDHADTALREWMGLAAYRISGKTDALFPGPAAE